MRFKLSLSKGVPGNYRSGHLLSLLTERDFSGYTVERRAPDVGVITEPSAALRVSIRERIKKDFLCHTTIAVFGLSVGEVEEPKGRIKVYHKGAVRRTGIGMKIVEASPDAADLATRLAADEALAGALLPLDFVRFEIESSPGGWRAEMEHFGGSEVCMRLPPSRRYVPLGSEQRDHLLAAFNALSRSMTRH